MSSFAGYAGVAYLRSIAKSVITEFSKVSLRISYSSSVYPSLLGTSSRAHSMGNMPLHVLGRPFAPPRCGILATRSQCESQFTTTSWLRFILPIRLHLHFVLVTPSAFFSFREPINMLFVYGSTRVETSPELGV